MPDDPIAVVLAAGQGTRMRSKTPKVLHPICGRPMVLWAVAAARAAGAAKVVVVGGPDRALEPILPPDVELAVQEEPRGTGHAVKAAAAHFADAGDTTVLVLNGDVPLVTAEALHTLVEAHHGAAATVTTMRLADPAGYGRVIRAREAMDTIDRIVETKAPGDATPEELAVDEVNAGIYAFAAEPLAGALQRIRADNAQGEEYLPDVLEFLRPVRAHLVDDPTLTLGINDRVDLAEVTRLAQARIHRHHQRAGVTIVDPASTRIDAGVELGRDTVVEPFTSLLGATRAGEDCRLGPNSVVVDARIEDGVGVGPFAYLRPGTVLRNGSKAGTFVEIKNSDIGEGTKVPHLSYIGDADVGPRTNLGAATITANYDGRAKHRTTVGSNVRTSVDTTLVAPVTVGDDAYTAAGSVITEDVPPGALGIARERQTNIANYAEKRARE